MIAREIKEVYATINTGQFTIKSHPFRVNMTTRILYAGEHWFEVQINGIIVHRKYFVLGI